MAKTTEDNPFSKDEIAASEEGVRNNAGKLPWHLLMWEAIAEVVRVLQMGAEKYAPRNWEKGMSWSDTYDSAQRHLYSWFVQREDNDKDSGLSHLAHAAWNILALLTYQLRGGHHLDNDDRPNNLRE